MISYSSTYYKIIKTNDIISNNNHIPFWKIYENPLKPHDSEELRNITTGIRRQTKPF